MSRNKKDTSNKTIKGHQKQLRPDHHPRGLRNTRRRTKKKNSEARTNTAMTTQLPTPIANP